MIQSSCTLIKFTCPHIHRSFMVQLFIQNLISFIIFLHYKECIQTTGNQDSRQQQNNKEDTIRLLRELENIVQGELKIYREVNDRKGKILTDAKKEAEEILTQAEQSASRIRVTKRMSTLPAFHPGDLEPEDREALRTAGDIYAASLIYTDEMLTEVNDLLADSYDLVKQQYAKMVETLEEKTRIVAENKAELMGNLKELSKEERYAQILELGQLLSNELYDEKNKVKLTAEKKKPVKLEYEDETGKEEKEPKS